MAAPRTRHRVALRRAVPFVFLAFAFPTLQGCATFANDESEWLGDDKFAHFFGSAALAAAGSDFLESGQRTDCQTAALSIGLSFSVGLGKEFYDRSQGKPFSTKDLVADLAGAMTGALISSRCP
ncbi:MAG: DUF2279 domain-containing protein [Hahellaceae bacterium]|jgi:putative lipoprotein|nr:DUF2279 domain-containing protein [Hahellaceae bacterium]